jgi:hypothetical protein
MANDELKQHIAAFLRDYSIEITPHDAGKLDAIRCMSRIRLACRSTTS